MSPTMSLRDSIKVVSFDLDDTFWDCAPAIAKAEQALFDWHRQVTPCIVDAHDPESLHHYRQQVRQNNPHLTGCVTAMRLQGLKQLMSEFGYPDTLAEQAFDVFYSARSKVELYPGVIDLLESVKERYGVVAITNGNADLEQIGIAAYFDKVFAADLTLKAKPHEDMFMRCQQHFSINGLQMLHIGDNPQTDVVGGLLAGVKTVWFNQSGEAWPLHEHVPCMEVQTIAQIHELLR